MTYIDVVQVGFEREHLKTLKQIAASQKMSLEVFIKMATAYAAEQVILEAKKIQSQKEVAVAHTEA